MDEGPGYHLARIERGVFGEPSKIREELCEFEDALHQGVMVMAIVELADLVGAIGGWLAKHHPSLTVHDLMDMAEINKRVFENGYRT